MAYKRHVDRLPIIPADAKKHNVTCHYYTICQVSIIIICSRSARIIEAIAYRQINNCISY